MNKTNYLELRLGTYKFIDRIHKILKSSKAQKKVINTVICPSLRKHIFSDFNLKYYLYRSFTLENFICIKNQINRHYEQSLSDSTNINTFRRQTL